MRNFDYHVHKYMHVYMLACGLHMHCTLHLAGLFLYNELGLSLERNIGEVQKMAARIPPHGAPSYMHGYQAAGRYMASHPSMVRYHYVIASKSSRAVSLEPSWIP